MTQPLSPSTLATLSRLSLLIALLGQSNLPVSDASIAEAYDISLEFAGSSGFATPAGGLKGGRGGVEKATSLLARPEVRERIVARLVSGR